MSSQIYIVETRYDDAASIQQTAFLNRQPDRGWSEQFQLEAAPLGSAIVLRQDRIESTGTAQVTVDDIVSLVNTRVAATA